MPGHMGGQVHSGQRIAGEPEKCDCRPIGLDDIVLGIQGDDTLADRIEHDGVPRAHVLGCPPLVEFDQGANPGHEQGGGNRLGQEVIGPGFESFDADLLVVQSCGEHDWYVPHGCRRPKATADGEAVLIRHHRVHQDEGG